MIKIGSAVLTSAGGQIDDRVLKDLVKQIAELIKSGRKVVLVSSGAIQSGMGRLQMRRRPHLISKKQALAAVGQVCMMNRYTQLFEKQGILIGQVLLTHEGLAERDSFLNSRHTLLELLELGVLPIVNENDSVSTSEIQFGDNDGLAVQVANLVQAPSVIYLSTAAGLMNLDTGEIIPEVKEINDQVFALARGGNSAGTGGMGSKLMSISTLVKAGKSAFLADGKQPGVLKKLFAGEDLGTRFLPESSKKMSSRRQWMSHLLQPRGTILVDSGAREALIKRKASLLSVGVTGVRGRFRAGDLVSISDGKDDFARGMSRFSADEITQIKGRAKNEIARILGSGHPAFVVHRNDIVIKSE